MTGVKDYFKDRIVELDEQIKTTHDYFGSEIKIGDRVAFAMIGGECCASTPLEGWAYDDYTPEICYKLVIIKEDNFSLLGGDQFKFMNTLPSGIPAFMNQA